MSPTSRPEAISDLVLEVSSTRKRCLFKKVQRLKIPGIELQSLDRYGCCGICSNAPPRCRGFFSMPPRTSAHQSSGAARLVLDFRSDVPTARPRGRSAALPTWRLVPRRRTRGCGSLSDLPQANGLVPSSQRSWPSTTPCLQSAVTDTQHRSPAPRTPSTHRRGGCSRASGAVAGKGGGGVLSQRVAGVAEALARIEVPPTATASRCSTTSPFRQRTAIALVLINRAAARRALARRMKRLLRR